MSTTSPRASLREREYDGVHWLETAGDGWRLAVTTRRGGVSEAPFNSLNLSYLVGDQPEAVRANREAIASALGLAVGDLVLASQVHGTSVRVVGRAERGRGAYEAQGAIPDTDALVTDAPGVALAISVADCVPVFVAGQGSCGGPTLGLVHAGWRGMAGGIVAAAVDSLAALGRLTLAIIGPSIGPCCFSVGDDVGQALDARFPGVWHEGHVDLWECARRDLVAGGVAEVHTCGICTSCDRRFFSHRRDGGRTGRQAAIAWIVEQELADAKR